MEPSLHAMRNAQSLLMLNATQGSYSFGQEWATPGTRAELGTRARLSGTRAIWPFDFLGDESWTLADVMTFFI